MSGNKGVFTLADTETDTQTDKKGLCRIGGGVHALQMLYLNFTLTCKAVCCAIFNKLHHHIFLSYELIQGGAPCDEAAHRTI